MAGDRTGQSSGRDPLDALLVVRAADGDKKAFEALFRRFERRLLAHAWRLTGEQEAAREVAQDAWLAITRGLRRLDDPHRFAPWAFRIVKNKAADHIRRRVRDRSALSDVPFDRLTARSADATGSDADDEGLSVVQAVRTLTPENRALVSLYYVEGFGVSEIAQAMGMEPGTVKSRLYRIRAALKGRLEEGEKPEDNPVRPEPAAEDNEKEKNDDAQ